jgi:hypothetical protein
VKGSLCSASAGTCFLAAILTIDDVVNGTGAFEAQLVSHEEKRVSKSRTVSRRNLHLQFAFLFEKLAKRFM